MPLLGIQNERCLPLRIPSLSKRSVPISKRQEFKNLQYF